MDVTRARWAGRPLPPLFRDRPQSVQIVLGGVIPAIVGAVAGIMIGVSGLIYWIVALIAAGGAFLSGLEHRDGWGGADRGFFSGAIYGIALLLVHAIVGTHAKVSLGELSAAAGRDHGGGRHVPGRRRRTDRPARARARRDLHHRRAAPRSGRVALLRAGAGPGRLDLAVLGRRVSRQLVQQLL